MFKKWVKNNITWALAFLIPICIMLFIFMLRGIYPFGENTILTVDLRGQYVGMLAYLREIYLGKGSLLYSFSKGLGGNMSGLFAYYLSSPLNLILVLFSKYRITEAILTITLIKVGLSGFTAAFYLNKHFHKKDSSIVVFSSCYALMSYNICLLSNIMWLDGIIWLPIILLGIERLIKKQKWALYLISLTISIYSNYYIGYMLCLASVLYFIYYIILQNLKKLPLKKVIGRFILSSLGAGGLTAFLLLPTLLSLKTGKMSFRLSESPLRLDLHLTELFSKFFIGGFNGSQLEHGFPNLFIGSLLLSLALGYFLNKQIKRKDKLVSACLLIFFYLSFSLSHLNLIWHGFDYPVCFSYRNAFIVSFLLIILAYQCYIHLKGLNLKHYIFIVIIWLIVGGLVWTQRYSFLSWRKIGLTIIFASCSMLCLYLFTHKNKKELLALASIFVYGELFLNAWAIQQQFSYFPRKYIVDSMKSFNPIIEKLYASGNFFRLEEFYQAVDTEPMLFGYYSMDHSSSAIEKRSVDFFKRLGICSPTTTVNQKYIEGGTLPTDMLFGIKYYLLWHQYKPTASIENAWSAQKDYSIAAQENQMTIYENPYALPIGYCVSQNILNALPETLQVFDLQNSLLNQIGATKTQYYTPVTIQNISCVNLKKSTADGETLYTKQDTSQIATITYQLMLTDSNAPLYMYLSSPRFETGQIKRNPVAVYVNGKDASFYFSGSECGIKNLGTYEKTQPVTVTLELVDQEFSMQEAFFYTLNVDALQTLHQNLFNQSISVTKWHEGYIEGDITASAGQLLMTSILYDSGWQVEVDHQKITPIAIQNALLGIPLEQGRHHIVIFYEVPGLKLGLAISLITLVIVISCYYVKRRKHE